MFSHWHRRPAALPRPGAPPVASWPRGLAAGQSAEIGLKSVNVTTPFEGLPDIPLGDIERLCLIHRAPPVASWLWVPAEQRNPFGPVPLQDLHPYYGLLRPRAPHRYSGPRGLSRL